MPMNKQPNSLTHLCIKHAAQNFQEIIDLYQKLGIDFLLLCQGLPPTICERLLAKILSFGECDSDHEFLNYLLRPGVRNIEMLLCKDVLYIEDYAGAYKTVTTVDLTLCSFEEFRLHLLVQQLPELVILNLTGTQCGDLVLKEIGETCKKIRKLILYGCKNVTDCGISYLCDSQNGIPNSRYLTILDVTDTSVTYRSLASALSILPLFHIRTYIRVQAAMIEHYINQNVNKPCELRMITFSDNFEVEKATTCFPHVKKILFYKVPVTCSQFLKLTSLYNLQSLSLTLPERNPQDFSFDKAILRFLTNSGQHLLELQLDNVSNINLNEIATHCKKLCCLILININRYYYNHEGGISSSGHFKELEQFYLWDPIVGYSSYGTLKRFFKCCTKLREIDIRNVPEITDDMVSVIAESLLKLEKLTFNMCDNITVKSIFILLQSQCPLKYLTILSSSNLDFFQIQNCQAFIEDNNLDVILWSDFQ